jgi:hypothetical protein
MLVCGQFDDAPDDESLAEEQGTSLIESSQNRKQDFALENVSHHVSEQGNHDANRLKKENANQSWQQRVPNQQERQADAITQDVLKPKVRFSKDVREWPVHVLLTYAPTKQFPSTELRRSSSRVNEGKKSIADVSRVSRKLKGKPGRTDFRLRTMRRSTETNSPSEAIMDDANTTNDQRIPPRAMQRPPGTFQPSTTMLQSSNNAKVTTPSKVAVSTFRAREVETAEVLRSLRQINKVNAEASCAPDNDQDCTTVNEKDDDVEVVGVFPRPSVSSVIPSMSKPIDGLVRRSDPQKYRHIAMPSNDHNEKLIGKAIQTLPPEMRKRKISIDTEPVKKRQRSQEEARLASLPVYKPAPGAPLPKSVTPPLSSVQAMWEGPIPGEPDLMLESQRQRLDETEVGSEAGYRFDVPGRKRLAAAQAAYYGMLQHRMMRPPGLYAPPPQAPTLAVPVVATKHPALIQRRPHPVVMVWPRQLLPPPIMPMLRSKTAVEGFVAPLNVPTVAEDKERKYPILNTGLRKRDVLFFAPLVRFKIQHDGTLKFCFLCFKYQDLYRKCSPVEKKELLNNLVRFVRSQGGRFLEWDAKHKCWYEIGDARANQRTMQGLSGEAPMKP